MTSDCHSVGKAPAGITWGWLLPLLMSEPGNYFNEKHTDEYWRKTSSSRGSATGHTAPLYKGSFQQVLRQLYFRQENTSPPLRERGFEYLLIIWCHVQRKVSAGRSWFVLVAAPPSCFTIDAPTVTSADGYCEACVLVKPAQNFVSFLLVITI